MSYMSPRVLVMKDGSDVNLRSFALIRDYNMAFTKVYNLASLQNITTSRYLIHRSDSHVLWQRRNTWNFVVKGAEDDRSNGGNMNVTLKFG
jgi:hypothetical protein